MRIGSQTIGECIESLKEKDLVCSLRKVEGLAWGQRGASVVRRGGAEALRSTAPPWLLVGLGTGQVPGKLGAQVSLRLGPQEVQRPLGALIRRFRSQRPPSTSDQLPADLRFPRTTLRLGSFLEGLIELREALTLFT